MSAPDMRVNVGGLSMKNPVTVASGTFGHGEEFADFFDVSQLGAVTTKGVSPVPWDGNATPRIAEAPAGMLNSIGLQNPGVEEFCASQLSWLATQDTAVIVNVSGHTLREYIQVVERLEDEPTVDAYEINISCPNVDAGGMTFGTDPDQAALVTSELRTRTKRPLIVKLTPNVTDISVIARAVADAGADAVSLINTLLGMAIDAKRRRPKLARVVGGLSGPAIKPVALRMVWEVHNAVDVPIIGMGGISNGEDAIEFDPSWYQGDDIKGSELRRPAREPARARGNGRVLQGKRSLAGQRAHWRTGGIVAMEWKNEPAADRIIVALDCSPDEAVVLGEKLAGHARWVKIGMTLYYAVGPSIVNTMHKLGFRVFLDLKLHDIPHQVYGAANSIAKAGADLFTVHASGGADMMQSAEKGARKGFSESPREGEPPAVCAITVLTSMDASQLEAIGIDVPPAEQVERLARLAHEAKLDGIVCSPIEAAQMRELLGPDAIIITPGVRPKGAALGDQSRVATPVEAFAAGASHLVIGRPITRAADPVAAFDEIASNLD